MTNRFLTVALFALAIIATASITLQYSNAGAGQGGVLDQEQVNKMIEQYLMENPEVIINSVQLARQKQQENELRAAQENIKERRDALERDAETPVLGNPDGDVVVVKFNDYNCGYCKRAAQDIEKLIAEDKNVRVVMKDFPILGARSQVNSKAALAFYALNKENYDDFHFGLMKSSPRNDAQLYALAEKHGVSEADMKREMEKDTHAKQLQDNLQLGQSIGVRGTPAFVINGELIRGAVGFDALKQQIAAARGKS